MWEKIRRWINGFLIVPFESPQQKAELVIVMTLVQLPQERRREGLEALIKNLYDDPEYSDVDWSLVRQRLETVITNRQ